MVLRMSVQRQPMREARAGRSHGVGETFLGTYARPGWFRIDREPIWRHYIFGENLEF